MPSRVEVLAQEWSETLGVEVSIDKLATPLPGLARLHDVSFRDPVSHDVIASCPRVSVKQKNGRWAVSLGRIEVQEAGLPIFWNALKESVRSRPGQTRQGVHVDIDDVMLIGKNRSSHFTDLDFWTYPHLYGRKATLEFKPALSGNDSLVHIDCDQQGDATTGKTRWSWSVLTGESALPASLLAQIVPELKSLGSKSKIRGQLKFKTLGDTSEGSFAGTLSGIDFGQLTKQAGLGVMTGRGRLDVRSASFKDGALLAVDLRLASDVGVMDSSLMQKLELLLRRQIRSAEAPSKSVISEAAVEYDRMALKLSISGESEGWRIEGDCENALPGALLVDRHGDVLLKQTAEQADKLFPLGDIAALFAAPESLWVPLSEQTRWLMSHLPPQPVGKMPKAAVKKPAAAERTAERDESPKRGSAEARLR